MNDSADTAMPAAALTALDWRLLQTFLAAAEAGSLGRAAVALGESQPTLSRRVAELEAALGQPLFERSPRGLAPTPVGRTLLGHARRMQQQVAHMTLAVERQARTLAGTVRITASDLVSQCLLLPALRPLRDAHPEIQIELAPGDDVADLLRRQADIALRMFRPREPALIARRLADLPVGLYAHRDYLARHGLVSLQTLSRHHWIGPDRGEQMLRGFAQAGHAVTRDFFAIRTDHSALAWQAVCHGLGVGAGLCQVAAQTPDLVRVLPDVAVAPMACWLVVHRELRGTPRLRVVADALTAAFSARG
ncbi:LysR family transcriptional regulator [Ottowia sp.]|uniref:LysR family transcriptional regulator n=1 Tax=Ottowia sp. TaxID=1898956 RepID=UPI002C4F8A8C|nr:LysR family transcriptional regulator [Ottowia sp.]HOB67574.1 LysR family transcriptional regulator [Ottowia sp.]HPZ56995.1 LysR family transcriptional regulator [Ottowia sp.]HQD49161.1 LysR family transcriptional regulator [Ottowia sp.]